MYIYIYIFIHVYIYIYMYVYIHIYIFIYTYLYIHNIHNNIHTSSSLSVIGFPALRVPMPPGSHRPSASVAELAGVEVVLAL